MEKYIRVKDRDTVLEISYEDMIKYHGRFNIGGVALAFKALELGLSKLVPAGRFRSATRLVLILPWAKVRPGLSMGWKWPPGPFPGVV